MGKDKAKKPLILDDGVDSVIRETRESGIERGRLSINAFLDEKGIEAGVDLRSKAVEGKSTATLRGDTQLKYNIGEVVAQGGMGAILDAQDLNCRRPVAMKVMLSNLEKKQDAVVRFINEAQITAQLEHPNIVPVHELSVNGDGCVFYTMKFVRGTNLDDILAGIARGDADMISKYPLNRLIGILLRASDAIAFANAKRVIHRDLKPENIMVGDYGEVLVLDWGLAKVIGLDQGESDRAESSSAKSFIDSIRRDEDVDGKNTMDGDILGTPQFMAPEQAEGKISSIDTRTDIYALGGILYNILTLRPPIPPSSLTGMLLQISRGEIANPATLQQEKKLPLPHLEDGHIPESLAAVAMKALSCSQADRYQSVEEFQADIEAYRGGFATAAEDAGMLKLVSLLVKRHKTEVALLAGAVAIIVAILTASFISLRHQKNEAVKQKVIADEQRDLALENERIATAEKEKAEAARRKAEDAIAMRKEVEEESAPEKVKAAREKITEGNLAVAASLIDRALEMDRTLESAHFVKARLLLRELDFSDAQEYLKSAPRNHETASYNIAAEKNRDGVTIAGIIDLATRLKHYKDRMILDPLLEQVVRQNRTAVEDPARIELALIAALMRLSLVEGNADMGELRSSVTMDGAKIRLDLSGIEGLYDLSPLQDLPIVALACSSSVPFDSFARLPLKELQLTKAKQIRIGDTNPFHSHRNLKILKLPTGKVEAATLSRMALDELHLDGTVMANAEKLESPQLALHLYGASAKNFQGFRNVKLRALHLYEPDLTDLPSLKGFATNGIGLHGRGVKGIDFLEKKNLHYLALTSTRVQDIGVVGNMPGLRTLILRDSPVRDLGALAPPDAEEDTRKRQPPPALQHLDISGTAIGDLAPIKRLPLTRFEASGSKIKNLSALSGKPLEYLDVSNTEIDSLKPLAASTKTLSVLRAHGTRIDSIEVLRKMPLRELSLDNCPALTDVSPLTNCKVVRRLTIPAQVKDYAFLEQHKYLRTLSTDWAQRDQPVLAFWVKHRLAAVNPGYDRRGEFNVVNGQITEVSIIDANLSNIQPLGVLPLTSVKLAGNAKLEDISPLSKMALRYLDVRHTSVEGTEFWNVMPLERILGNQ